MGVIGKNSDKVVNYREKIYDKNKDTIRQKNLWESTTVVEKFEKEEDIKLYKLK